MLERLQIRNWVLTVRGPALYGFVHRTFLEYLCALELSERFKAQQLSIEALIASHVVARLDDDAWHEVVRLLIGSLPPPAAEQVLLAIVPSEAEEVFLAMGRDEVELKCQVRFAFAWQGLAEVEPRHIPTMVTICTKLTDLLYAWLVGGAAKNTSYYIKEENYTVHAGRDIIEAVNSIGRIAWPVLHPPAGKWPEISQCDSIIYVDVIAALARRSGTAMNRHSTLFEYLPSILRTLVSLNRLVLFCGIRAQTINK